METQNIKMGMVGLVGKYLGCDHKRQTSTIDGQPTQAIDCAMRQLMRSCGCLPNGSEPPQ